MSIKGSVNAECPHCGEKFEADFWTVVRGDKDPELKETLIGGEFDLLMCPACSRIFPCKEPFIYMDPGRELLVFVMPSVPEEERPARIEKMRVDYAAIRNSAAVGEALEVEPLYHFGAEALSELLLRDRDMEEETEVMAFMAAERGFKTVPLRAGFARTNDLPFSAPCSGCPCRTHALKAARAILADNDALVRVKNLLKVLEDLRSEELPFAVGLTSP